MELNLKVKEHNLIIIGTNHKQECYKLFEKTLVPFAVKKEIGLFQEGIKRDDSAELLALKNLYNLKTRDKGYFFGIEDEFVNAFCGVVLHYLYFINNLQSEYLTIKAQMVYDILANDTVKSYWQNCQNSCNLAKDIKNYLANNKGKGLKSLINNLNQLEHYGNIEEWINLLHFFINLMLGDAIKRGVDQNLMKSLLEDPKNEKYHTEFVEKINGFWRDTYIVANVKNTLSSNAIPKNLKVYLLIGEAHLSNLEKLFKKGGYK